MRVRIKNILIGVVLGLISLSTYTHGQSTSTPAQETVKWAQGKTEAVFLDGPIVLRIISQENGASEVRWQMRDNKETLLFKVGVRDGKKGSAGLMYVTAGGVEYFPDDAKQDKLAFRREKTSIKMVKLESKGRIFAPTSYVDFKATDGFDCKIFGL